MLLLEFFVVLAAALAVAKATTPATPGESICKDSYHGHSLVVKLLHETGFSEVCIATALEKCSNTTTISEEKITVMKEVRGLVQQVTLVVEETRGLAQIVTLAVEETRGLAQIVTLAVEETRGLAKNVNQTLEEVQGIVTQMNVAANNSESRPRHCKDLHDSGDRVSGLRQVYPYRVLPHHPVTVYCNHTVDGGGWTVFQRRTNDSLRQDFYRTWTEYQLGFGDLEGEFWLGLDLLHELTSNIPQELRVDLEDYDGGHRWAKYGVFQVGAPDTKYILKVGRYNGTAGDAMEYHNGMKFSTHDADHDTSGGVNCASASAWRGAWWYRDCGHSNLNGYHQEGPDTTTSYQGIYWYQWGGYYSLRRTTMMIRPAF